MAVIERPRSGLTQPTVPDAETFVGDELIAIPTTAGGTPLAAVPSGARHAVIQNLDASNSIILRLTGTNAAGTAIGGNPDATHGIVIKAGTTYDLHADPSLVKLLAVTASVNVYVMYFGRP